MNTFYTCMKKVFIILEGMREPQLSLFNTDTTFAMENSQEIVVFTHLVSFISNKLSKKEENTSSFYGKILFWYTGIFYEHKH